MLSKTSCHLVQLVLSCTPTKIRVQDNSDLILYHLKTYLHNSKQWARYCTDAVLRQDLEGEFFPTWPEGRTAPLCANVGASRTECNIFSINTNTPCTRTIFCVHTTHVYTHGFELVLNTQTCFSVILFQEHSITRCLSKNRALVSYNDNSVMWCLRGPNQKYLLCTQAEG